MSTSNLAISWPDTGHYVLAVSGGCDSIVLLDLLARAAGERGYQLTVAHFDHQMRPESSDDANFVAQLADHYGLAIQIGEARTPPAGEAAARAARYDFLEQVRAGTSATAIITAHHRDDLIETSLLNLARGTGRRGLAPMLDGAVVRPLLDTTRAALQAYAHQHHLAWHEDATNRDTANPRNFLRHRLLPAAPPDWEEEYLLLIQQIGELNKATDQLLSGILDTSRRGNYQYLFDRRLIRDLSLFELAELLTEAVRRLSPGQQLHVRLVQELALFCKTAAPGRARPVRGDIQIMVGRDALMLSKG